jgi:hypothetical protein
MDENGIKPAGEGKHISGEDEGAALRAKVARVCQKRR